MKKIVAMILAFVMCLSLCACGGGNNTPETEAPTETSSSSAIAGMPNFSAEDVANAIKYEFKDPESVYLSDAWAAAVKHDEEISNTEFYIIATVHAKNSFGGYADPKTYLMYWKSGSCSIVGEHISNDMPQKKFSELGCFVGWPLK